MQGNVQIRYGLQRVFPPLRIKHNHPIRASLLICPTAASCRVHLPYDFTAFSMAAIAALIGLPRLGHASITARRSAGKDWCTLVARSGALTVSEKVTRR